MSAYIHFFVRSDDKFIRLDTYSRSSMMFQEIAEEIPYEKVRCLKTLELEDFRSCFETDIDRRNDRIEELKRQKETIYSFNNSVREKLEAVREIDEQIDEEKEEAEELERCINFINGLIQINRQNEVDNMIYCSYERFDPTVEDIVEE